MVDTIPDFVFDLTGRKSSAMHGSMRGFQTALSEGWIIQKSRDVCSFAHDRYRQAAVAEALNLPEDVGAKMSFRVHNYICLLDLLLLIIVRLFL